MEDKEAKFLIEMSKRKHAKVFYKYSNELTEISYFEEDGQKPPMKDPDDPGDPGEDMPCAMFADGKYIPLSETELDEFIIFEDVTEEMMEKYFG